MSRLSTLFAGKYFGTIGAALLLPLLVAAHSPALAQPAPYVVGFTDVLSGPNAGLGTPVLQGAQTYFNALNAKGGVNGRRIELRAIDSQGDSTRVVTALQDLSAANAVAVMGLTIAGNTEAAAPIANRLKLPILSAGLSPKLLNPFQPFIFASDITTASQAQMKIDFIRKHLLPGKSDLRIAIYINQSAGVIAYVAILKELMAKEQPGWKVVAEEVVPLTATDAGVPAAKILAANPDVVIFGAIDTVALMGVRAMMSQGLKVPVVNFHAGNAENTFLQLNNPNYYAIRQYPTTQEPPPGKGYAEMIGSMKTAGLYEGLLTSFNAITGYTTAMQIATILGKCGANCNSESFQKTALSIGQIDTGGITFRPISYSPTRRQAVDTGRFYHNVGGKLVPVGDSYTATYGQP